MPSTTTSLHSALPQTARWPAGSTMISDWPVYASPKIHSTTPATNRPSAASTNMRSELPLKAAYQNFLMAVRRHCYRKTDTAKEDKNYAGTTAHRLQPNPWLVHELNRFDSEQPLPRLGSFASWHPPPFRQPFEADHIDSRIAMDFAGRNRETPLLGDWWDEKTTTTCQWIARCQWLRRIEWMCRC